MRENEERLRFALRASNAGVWEWDMRTNGNVWSETLWDLYGLEPQSCEPTFDAWMQTVHPDDRDAVAGMIREASAEGKEFTFEWRRRDKTGSTLAHGARRSHAAGDRPGLSRYIGVVIDITARKRAEMDLMISSGASRP